MFFDIFLLTNDKIGDILRLNRKVHNGGMFMYTSLTSVKVTRVITVIYCIMLLLAMIFAPSILMWYFGSGMIKQIKVALIAFYSCCPAAWIALVCVWRVLTSILKGNIFTDKMVFSMRLLSWCCGFVAVDCFVAGFWDPAFFIFAVGAAFMMLILRVLKSVMAKATEIKNENELTI